MSKGYTKAEMFVDEDGGRSLHNDLAKFFSQALHFQTPLRTILKSTELANAIRLLSSADKSKHQQFISDMKATKALDLWPDCNGILPQKCNMAAMWSTINIHLPAFEDDSSNNITQIVNNNENLVKNTKKDFYKVIENTKIYTKGCCYSG